MRVHLFPERLELTPGEPAAVQVDIFNDRDVIDSFVVSLLGLGGETLSVQPPELSLFPASEGSVTIVFTPSDDLAAGRRSAGVKVSSTTDVSVSQVEPLPISVAERTAIVFDVQPQTVSGGSRAHFGLTVENRGNTKASVTLSGADSEQAMEFRMSSPRLDVPPGGRKVARAVASGKRPFMGTPVARVITFRADGAGPRQEAMSTFIQRPRVSRGLVTFVTMLAAAAAVLLALFVGFSKLLAKQQVKTAAASSTAAAAGSGAGKGAAGSSGASGSAGTGGAGSGAAGGAGNAQISGTVVGPNPVPAQASPGTTGVGGALIAAHPAANPTQLATATVADSSGAFTLTGLAPGSYKLSATAMGYHMLWYPAAATPDLGMAVIVAVGAAAPPVTFVLDGLPGSVSGTIQSVTGPVAGAQVSIAGSNQPGVMSGADGSFTLSGLATPAVDQLVIAKSGFPTAALSVDLAAGEQLTGQQLLLSIQSGTVSGTVTDDQGTPIAGATVNVDNINGALLSSATTMATGTVGFFIVSGLPTPAQDNVVVNATGYRSAISQISVAAGMASVNLSPQLIPIPVSLAGTVTRAATPGAPCPPCTLAGVSVTAVGKSANGTATTAADGTYSIPNLRPGQYTVTYASAGYTTTSATVIVAPGQNGTESATLVGTPVTVAGTVRCNLLTDLSGSGKVSLTTAKNVPVPGVAVQTVKSPGSFAFYAVPSPGSYVIKFAFSNGTSTDSIQVLAGQPLLVPQYSGC